MLIEKNFRIVIDGQQLSFTAPKTGSVFVFTVEFVATMNDKGDIIAKGVKIGLPVGNTYFPEKATLVGPGGEAFKPGGDYIIPKGDDACSVTDEDGSTYRLFKVDMVDEGQGKVIGMKRVGGVLYFIDTNAIPPELGGQGLLAENPKLAFE